MNAIKIAKYIDIPSELYSHKGIHRIEDRMEGLSAAVYMLHQLIGDEGPVDTVKDCFEHITRVCEFNFIELNAHKELSELRNELIVRYNAWSGVLKHKIELELKILDKPNKLEEIEQQLSAES